jgi:adenosylcobyric acid synthase
MPARPIFIGGTSSNAGKSWMATALCAWLRQHGISVAPFKAQNMSNNSYPCRQGGEIGRAQVVQAEACGLEPEPAMNPILLKPNGAGSSQVVLNGRIWKTLPPRGYYQHADELRRHVLAAYEDLASRFRGS